ncbi:MAG: alpha-amlyase [Chitinophagaceae bacterium]|nr:MAG: alpha-amlyase [Chitinophagaceae bacterium]
MPHRALFTILSLFLLTTAIAQPRKPAVPLPADRPKPYVLLRHPEWSRQSVIYQVNIRQYTPEGTFKAFAAHLPRLQALGVDILWLMPVHPIGVKHRKGTLGSEYSIRDYYGINPEYGTMADFHELVQEVHRRGMHLILDWVANHSAWDNPLVTQHPDWYTRTASGGFQPTPWYDWDDVIDFDYQKPGVRRYMTEALKWWVRETGIDGFRCDVAGFIPVDFWDRVRQELDAIKPVFLLAEWEARDMHRNAFDATYSWSLYDKLHAVTTEGKDFAGLVEWFAHDVNTWPEDAYRMLFTDNHDKNSWTGTPFTQFGAGLEAATVLTFVARGIPLIYGGQEAGNPKMLRFFDKDTILWNPHPFTQLYQKLIAFKRSNKALWNGAAGGVMDRIGNDRQDGVLSFYRGKGNDGVLAVFNFSNRPLVVALDTRNHSGRYRELFSGEELTATDTVRLELAPWAYRVYAQKKR